MLDKETRRLRRTIKVAYITALSFYPIAVIVIIYLSVKGFVPMPLRADAGLDVNTVQILFIVVSLIFLIVGLFWPRLARWHKKEYVNDVELLYGHVARATFFSTPAIYGIIMSMLGGSWYIVALILIYVLEFAALIWTFPTEKRLAKWRGK